MGTLESCLTPENKWKTRAHCKEAQYLDPSHHGPIQSSSAIVMDAVARNLIHSPEGTYDVIFHSECNNRIVITQRKHLDYFLRGRIIERLECGRTQLEVSEELGITQSVISRLCQRFQDDGNVSRCYSTGRPRVTTPNEDRYIWQLLPKETDGAQHQTCLVSSLQLPVRQFQGRPCTDA
ncbi:uncharacterized protein TNCV_766031 [Trichonephila clavipes]|nr:uncharacterized protein TNCV_766031 [Trichonephila clavipes]